MTITDKYKNFIKTYKRNIVYATYYRYYKKGLSDEEISKLKLLKGNHKTNTLRKQYYEWLKDNEHRSYEWYIRRRRKGLSLTTEKPETIKDKWRKYCDEHGYVSYSWYWEHNRKPRLVEKTSTIDKVEKKLNLNIDTKGDDYYLTL